MYTAASDAISAMTVVPSADYVHAAQWLCWHGRMNRLPKDYKFPTSINGKIIWDLFCFGMKFIRSSHRSDFWSRKILVTTRIKCHILPNSMCS